MTREKRFFSVDGCHETIDGNASDMRALSFSDEQQYVCRASFELVFGVGSSPTFMSILMYLAM
jgi:hypothetical protein